MVSDALAVLGDWNATPRDRGRWSPYWLTRKTDLRLHSAGPGLHGDIDFGLVDPSCSVWHIKRTPPPPGTSRSDHDLVSMGIRHGGEILWVGTWNLRYGRDPRTVRGQVVLELSRLNLDILCLQEAADYHQVLDTIPGYRMIAYPAYGKWHNVVLVRDGLQIRRPASVRLSPRGWRLATLGRHSPLWGTAVTVEWLRVLDIHMPPSVNWRRGRIWGPPMRVAAYASAAGRIRAWHRHHSRP